MFIDCAMQELKEPKIIFEMKQYRKVARTDLVVATWCIRQFYVPHRRTNKDAKSVAEAPWV